MRRAAIALALLAAGAAAPVAAQSNGEVTITTPDGSVYDCQIDYPGASFEANLIADGWTERFEIAAGERSVIYLCRP